MTDFPLLPGKRRLDVLGDVDGWLVLVTAALCLCGIVFIGSATRDDPVFHEQQALAVDCRRRRLEHGRVEPVAREDLSG